MDRKAKIKRLTLLAGLALLFFLIPLAFYPWVTTFRMTKETGAEVLLLVLGAAWFFWKVEGGEEGFSARSPLSIPVLAFGAALLVSLARVGPEHLYASLTGLAQWLSYLLAFFLVITVIRRREVNYLLVPALAAGVVAAGYLICQFYGVDFNFWAWIGGRGRLFSTFGNPNYVAGYLIGCLPPLFVWFLRSSKGWRKGCAGILVATLYTAVLMTRTRASWAALIGAAVLTLLFLYLYGRQLFSKRNGLWLVGLAILLAGVTVIYSIPDNPLNTRRISVSGRAASATNLKQGSLQRRFLFWSAAVEIATDHPFIGNGVGTYKVEYPRAQGEVLARKANNQLKPLSKKTLEAHNELLQTWAETGILGVVAALGIIAAFYYQVITFLKRDFPSSEKFTLIALAGGAAALLGHCVFSFPFHVMPNGLLFFLFLGLSWVVIRSSRSPEGDQARPSGSGWTERIPRWPLTTGVVVICFLLGMGRIMIFRADLHLKAGITNLEKHQYSKARLELEQAQGLMPYNGKIYAYLAMAYNQLGRYREAIEASKEAEEDYLHQTLYQTMGEAYRELGEVEKATQAFEENIRLFPNQASAYLDLIRLYMDRANKQLGKGNPASTERLLDRAFFYYQQVKVFDPSIGDSSATGIPTKLANNYYRVGLKKKEKRRQNEGLNLNINPYFPDKPVLEVLTPAASAGKPIYLKLFFYTGSSEAVEGEVEIADITGETVKELKVTGQAPIYHCLVNEPLPAGRYKVTVKMDYGGKIARTSDSFLLMGGSKKLETKG